MAEATTTKKDSRRKVLLGEVVSTRMQKTIIIEVQRKKRHPLYNRIVARSRRCYAHDERGEAHLGDIVRVEETRPLSRLKRWRLIEIVRRAAIVPAHEAGEQQAV
jgi:small subunit ribosomal protein S17